MRLPSGAERPGVVFYRGADAACATQRDVSRTKRDIKTFEVRLRVDNRDRALAVSMTVYVSLPGARSAALPAHVAARRPSLDNVASCSYIHHHEGCRRA